jgi:hypothetical protein
MKFVATILVIAVLLLECAACTSQPSTPAVTQPSTPTITSDDSRCEYSGPDSIQADQFTFQWVFNGQKYTDVGIAAIQVEEGQSVDDLVGIKYKDAPPWISLVRYEMSRTKPGPWTKEVTWDLTVSGRFHPGFVYFSCAHTINDELTLYGFAGPVEAGD